MTTGASQSFGAFGTRLRFEATAFVWDGNNYPYVDVRGIEFKQHAYKPRADGDVKMLYESYLRIVFAGGKRLTIRLKPGFSKFIRTHDKQVHANVKTVADWFGAYTFNVRMDAYMADFRLKKYIAWGNYQITESGDLFYRHAYCMNLRSEQVRSMLFPFHLACLRRPEALWKRALEMLLKRREVLDLRRDRDCFLYLMERYVRLKWPSEVQRIYRGVAADGSKPAANGAKAENVPPRERIVCRHLSRHR